VAPTAAGALAHQVVSHGLRFAGLQAYHGGAQHLRSAEAREAAIRHVVALVRAAQAGITASGLRCALVTGAGTGSFAYEAASGVYGELQCGSYLFMDRDYADNEPLPHAPRFEHALFVKSQVVSRGTSHAVVDAGHKSHAVDSGLPAVWQRPLAFANGGDEHGILRPRAGDTAAALPALGETVWLVPGHCDPTVNLHDHYLALRGGLERGVVEAVWTIDARGAVR
jgi:D-serine deaminase-like pyridoxal phosphate-dependent protein